MKASVGPTERLLLPGAAPLGDYIGPSLDRLLSSDPPILSGREDSALL